MTEQSSFSALGTTATVMVAGDRQLDAAVAAVKRTAEASDRACSRFRDDSELSALNRAAGRAVAAGPVLLEAVAAAIRAAEVTQGDVDPSLGAALIVLGYDRDFDLGLGDRGPGGESRAVEGVDWGYPILDSPDVPPELVRLARRAAEACPTLALLLEERRR